MKRYSIASNPKKIIFLLVATTAFLRKASCLALEVSCYNFYNNPEESLNAACVAAFSRDYLSLVFEFLVARIDSNGDPLPNSLNISTNSLKQAADASAQYFLAKNPDFKSLNATEYVDGRSYIPLESYTSFTNPNFPNQTLTVAAIVEAIMPANMSLTSSLLPQLCSNIIGGIREAMKMLMQVGLIGDGAHFQYDGRGEHITLDQPCNSTSSPVKSHNVVNILLLLFLVTLVAIVIGAGATKLACWSKHRFFSAKPHQGDGQEGTTHHYQELVGHVDTTDTSTNSLSTSPPRV